MVGKWIVHQSDDTTVNRELYFRKDFYIKSIKKTSIRICASDRYKLFINNQLVEVGPQKPAKQQRFYDLVDVTSYLHGGLNQIGVIVLTYSKNSGARMFSLVGNGSSGLWIDSVECSEIETDRNWKVYDNSDVCFISESSVFAPLQIYEDRIANQQLHNWLIKGENELDWPFAIEKTDTDGREMIPRETPFLYRKKRCFQGVVVIRESDIDKTSWEDWLQGKYNLILKSGSRHIIEVNAGELSTGFLNWQLAHGKRSRISILQSEGYVTNERTVVNGLDIPIKKNRLDFEKGHLEGFRDTYAVGGFGTNDVPELFQPYWFRTFRFIRLEIEVGEEDLVIGDFNYDETGYPLRVKTQVETSDQSLSAIWKLSERTLRRCMHETYEDCPFYEQLQYVMDTRAQALYTYAVSADDRLARSAMAYFKDSQYPSGLLNGAAPSNVDNIIPTFSIFYILMVLDHWKYFGDINLVHQHFSTVQKILDYFASHISPRGMVERIGTENGKSSQWSFVDWTKEWQASSGVPIVNNGDELTMDSLFYLMGLEAAQELALAVGNDQFYKLWNQSISSLKVALKNYAIDDEGIFKDGPTTARYSQHTQVFAILTDVVSQKEGKDILLKTIQNPEHYAQCSVAMSLYLFQALDKVGLYELTNHYWDDWRQMLAKNLTTSVEAIYGERSDCHAWGAVALYILPTYTLGIQPLEPGFNRILIAPKIGHLTWANGSVVTPKGLVTISWQVGANGLDVSYQAPEGVQVIVDKNKKLFKEKYS